jgi:hypothetical protein
MCPYFKTTNCSTSTLTKESLLLGKIVQFVSTKDMPELCNKKSGLNQVFAFVCVQHLYTARLDFSNLLLILDGVQKQVFAHLYASGETKIRLPRR